MDTTTQLQQPRSVRAIQKVGHIWTIKLPFFWQWYFLCHDINIWKSLYYITVHVIHSLYIINFHLFSSYIQHLLLSISDPPGPWFTGSWSCSWPAWDSITWSSCSRNNKWTLTCFWGWLMRTLLRLIYITYQVWLKKFLWIIDVWLNKMPIYCDNFDDFPTKKLQDPLKMKKKSHTVDDK